MYAQHSTHMSWCRLVGMESSPRWVERLIKIKTFSGLHSKFNFLLQQFSLHVQNAFRFCSLFFVVFFFLNIKVEQNFFFSFLNKNLEQKFLSFSNGNHSIVSCTILLVKFPLNSWLNHCRYISFAHLFHFYDIFAVHM